MSKGIGNLQIEILKALVKDQTGDNPPDAPNGAYSTRIGLLNSLLDAETPSAKRSMRRALQGLERRRMIRRDGRCWCAVTSQLEGMRERRKREFEAIMSTLAPGDHRSHIQRRR